MIEPLIDDFSGIKLYHYSCNNMYYATIMTRNVNIWLIINEKIG